MALKFNIIKDKTEEYMFGGGVGEGGGLCGDEYVSQTKTKVYNNIRIGISR